MRGGQLIHSSVDVYLVTDYCDQGDLFNLRGQLPEAEVQRMMWQLLTAVQYLHSKGWCHQNCDNPVTLISISPVDCVFLSQALKRKWASARSKSANGQGRQSFPICHCAALLGSTVGVKLSWSFTRCRILQ